MSLLMSCAWLSMFIFVLKFCRFALQSRTLVWETSPFMFLFKRKIINHKWLLKSWCWGRNVKKKKKKSVGMRYGVNQVIRLRDECPWEVRHDQSWQPPPTNKHGGDAWPFVTEDMVPSRGRTSCSVSLPFLRLW